MTPSPGQADRAPWSHILLCVPVPSVTSNPCGASAGGRHAAQVWSKPGGPAGTVDSRHRDSAETEQERQTGAGKNGPGKHRRMRDGPLEGKHLEGRGQSDQVPYTGAPRVGTCRGAVGRRCTRGLSST